MFPSLNAEMARLGIRTKDIAEVLGVKQRTARHKITTKSHFTDSEMGKIRDKFFPGMTIDYLFFDGLDQQNNPKEGCERVGA